MNFLRQLFSSGDFMPHGYCYLWNPELVWLHVISDALIALVYFTIPFTLLRLVRKRRDLPFNSMIVLFGVFIVACGGTHAMEIWNLWHAEYWLAGIVKAVTAASSVGTAILLVQLVPKAAKLPDVNQWIQANAALESEIHERRELEIDLRISEARYRDQAELLDLTHDAILVRNLRSEITYWNRAAERLYGWGAEEARGKLSHELLQTVFPKPFDEIAAEILTRGSWEGELIHQRRDGSVVTVYSRWALRTGTDGNSTVVLESNRDITHTKQEQQKFRNLLEAAPDAIVIVNHAGYIQLVNAQTETLFGYSREELIGKPVEVLVPNRFQDSHRDDRHSYERSPRRRSMAATLELFGRRKDGSEFPAEISLNPLETPNGVLISSAIRDVTQRKVRAERLRQQEVRFRLLIDAVKDYAIISLDPAGLITTWNSGAQRLKGYAAEEIIGEHVSRLYPPETLTAGRLEDELREAEASGHVEDHGWRVRKDGSCFWAEVVTTALRDPAGKLVGFVKIDRDITARRAAEDQIQKLNTELHQRVFELDTANKELESFSYSVSHDLRAPLRHVDGFTRILKEEYSEGIPAEGLKYLDRILDAATHMGQVRQQAIRAAALTKQLLAFARRQILEPRNIDLNQSVTETRSLLEKVIGSNIEIKINLAAELALVRADPTQVEQVLMNLCINARDAMAGGGRLSIETSAATFDERYCAAQPFARPGDYAMLAVTDNGTGMDAATLDRIFEPFFTTKEMGKGTGLGLATVYGIVRQHGGFLHVYSELNVGTTFRVYLPITSSSVKAEVFADETDPVRGGSETILIAEDHEGLRGLARETLSNLGYDVVLACDGEQAIREFQQQADRIDLLLLDVVMPKMDGPEAYARMSAKRPDVPVIFATGYSADIALLHKVQEQGLAVMQKPYVPRDLARRVRETLDRHPAKVPHA